MPDNERSRNEIVRLRFFSVLGLLRLDLTIMESLNKSQGEKMWDFQHRNRAAGSGFNASEF